MSKLDQRRRPRNVVAAASTTLLLVALTYGAVAHGAFHAGELALVVALVAVALLCAFAAVPPSRADLGAPTLAAAALALWYVVAGLLAGHVSGAGPAVGLLFAAAAAIAIVRRADDAEREVVLTGVLAIGGLVALSGWIGVAFHHRPWAIEDNGLWRAASTITYANATGGLLGALALVALDRVLDPRAARPRSVLATLLVLGLLATAGRGALVGFAIGFVVLVVLRRRERLAALVPCAVGAGIAFVALLPSMPSGHGSHLAVAIVGVVLGMSVAVAPGRVAIAVAVACVGLGLGSAGLRHDVAAGWKPISTQRLNAGSSDRSHERRAGLRLARDHLLTGVGPGNVTLRWTLVYFVPVGLSVHYAHDEYLQLLDESGVVGLAIAIVGIGCVLAATRRSALRQTRGLAAAGIGAALVMLAVHSATDFLWHVPIIPIAVSSLVGVLTPSPAPPRLGVHGPD